MSIICAKSAPTKSNLETKINLGFKDIEIQLLGDFLDKENEYFLDQVLSVNDINIRSIHTPLGMGRDSNIEDLHTKKGQFILDKTFQFAQAFAEAKNLKEII